MACDDTEKCRLCSTSAHGNACICSELVGNRRLDASQPDGAIEAFILFLTCSIACTIIVEGPSDLLGSSDHYDIPTLEAESTVSRASSA